MISVAESLAGQSIRENVGTTQKSAPAIVGAIVLRGLTPDKEGLMAETMPPVETPENQARYWESLVMAARQYHQPSVASAGEYEDGTCAYCQADPTRPLLQRYRDHLNGAKRKVWMHDHPDTYPCCVTCAAGYEDRQDWPCATALALGLSEG